MKQLRGGYTTGACAAAAAKAAVRALLRLPGTGEVEIGLPDGERVIFETMEEQALNGDRARAAVRKSAGDDPDVTDGAMIVVEVERIQGKDIVFRAGEGVGAVTLPGLALQPGEPAINPGPRNMIREAIGEITDHGFAVTVSIPGGRALSERTFNPRLGIVGGLSVLGTSGRVVPYSCEGLREALRCGLDVMLATETRPPIFVPGNIGRKAAEKYFRPGPQQVVEVSNEWGFMLDLAAKKGIMRLLSLGHPGKLAKLAMGYWNTHSRHSPVAASFVRELAGFATGRDIAESITVEGVFQTLTPEASRRTADTLAARIAGAITERLKGRPDPSVILINLKGEWLGSFGDLTPWTTNRGSPSSDAAPAQPTS